MTWKDTFNAMAEKVGFHLQDISQQADADFPAGELVDLWLSSYAALLLWSPKCNLQDIAQRQLTVQGCFDGLLLKHEKDGQGTFDGFMVVILSETPKSKDMIDSFYKMQANTSVCRKHVLWPEKNGHTDMNTQILELTPLGLPNARKIVDAAQLPELTEKERSFIEDIERNRSGKQVAEEQLTSIGFQLRETSDEVE